MIGKMRAETILDSQKGITILATRSIIRSVIITTAATAIMLVVALSSSGRGAETKPSPQELTVAHCDEYAPLAFLDKNGAPAGYLIDYWRAWGERNNVTIRFKLVPWAESIELVRRGEADLHGGLFFNEKRDAFLDFSVPIITLQSGLFVRKSHPAQTVEELGDTTVGVITGDAVEPILRNRYPGMNIVNYATHSQQLQAMADGSCDAVTMEFHTEAQALARFPEMRQFRLLTVVTAEPLRAAVREGNTSILTLLNREETQVPPETLKKLYTRWHRYPFVISWGEYAVLLGAGLIAIALIIVLLLNRRRTKRQARTLAHALAESERQKNEAEENLARTQAMIAAFDGLIYICSEDLTVEFMNKAMIRRTGRDATGEPCYRALHDLNEKCPWCKADRTFKGETVRWETCSPKDGRWYCIVNTPIHHPDGRISKMAMIQDITEHKNAQSQLRLMQFSMEHSADEVYWLHPDGSFAYVNLAACKALGYTKDELLKLTVFDLDPKASRETWVERWQAMKISNHLAIETTHKRKNGSKYPVSITANYIQFEDQEILCAFARDITERKRNEDALRRAHDELERRVEERTVELRNEIQERENLQQELIRSERLAAVGTLASGLAHEFNNINVSVLGFADLALEQEGLNDQLRDFLGRIGKAARRAGNITRNLLAFTAGEKAGRMEAGDLSSIAQEAMQLMGRELEKSRIDVTTDLQKTPLTRMKVDQIWQVLVNFLINAQHAMLGSHKRQLCIRTGADEDKVFAEVEDTGCGIRREDIPKIFSPFYTTKGEHASDPDQARVRGTGLGLSVCHTIVLSHDGQILVDSQPGEGTCFRLELPLRDISLEAKKSATKMPDRDIKGTVLVVDDEIDTQTLIAMSLEQKGVTVLTTASGDEAVRLVEENDVDVVLLDVQMPNVSGVDLAERFLQLPAEKQPAIVFITGDTKILRSFPENIQNIPSLQKPFDLHDLRDCVAAALARSPGNPLDTEGNTE